MIESSKRFCFSYFCFVLVSLGCVYPSPNKLVAKKQANTKRSTKRLTQTKECENEHEPWLELLATHPSPSLLNLSIPLTQFQHRTNNKALCHHNFPCDEKKTKHKEGFSGRWHSHYLLFYIIFLYFLIHEGNESSRRDNNEKLWFFNKPRTNMFSRRAPLTLFSLMLGISKACPDVERRNECLSIESSQIN